MTTWLGTILDWLNKAPTRQDVERWEKNTQFLYENLTSEKINLLTYNSRNNAATVDNYPMGISVMRVNSETAHGFPETFGNVETIRTTNITATQRFTGTGSDASIYIRQTSTGVWQPWSKIVTQPTIITNANGTAIRYPDGTQECYHELTLSLNDGDNAALRNTWTYPATFAANPQGLAVTLAEVSSAFAPAKTMISYIGADNNGTTSSIPIAMYRINGMTNFAAGNTARVKLKAQGRWK